MITRKLAAAVVVLGGFGASAAAIAEGAPPLLEQGEALVERLDEFGRKIFEGILPIDRKADRKASAPQPALHPPAPQGDPAPRTGWPTSRAGSILNPRPRAAVAPPARSAARSYDLTDPEVPLAPNYGGSTALPVRRDPAESLAAPSGGRPVWEPTDPPTTSPAAARPRIVTNPPASGSAADSEVGAAAGGSFSPLHERLSAFRDAKFGPAEPVRSASPPEEPTKTEADSPPDPSTAAAGGQPTEKIGEARVDGGGQPTVAVPRVAATPAETRGGVAPADAPAPTPAATQPPRPQSDPNVLFARKGPALSVETTGPRRIMVGKESAYEVVIVNSGEVAADDVEVLVSLPDWADVLGAEVSTGATRPAADAASPFTWRLGRLEAKARQRLVLRIVPRQSRPFDLAVRWNYSPPASQAAIEVQEPKLVMRLEGPREILYGKKEVFALRLSNAGNGPAENLLITLWPIGSGENPPASHNLGTLAAGEEKTLEVELTARQAGNLLIRTEVRGEDGVRAELAETVVVRRAALALDVAGPQVQYVGAAATYLVCVRNPGTAAASRVNLAADIPAGAKYLGGIEGGSLAADGAKLQWTIDSLPPGAEQTFALKCALGLPGANRLGVVCDAENDLSASAGLVTRVETVADLVLDVVDPAGPVPAGEEALYEIHVRNRGTRGAEAVEVVGYFSRGIEPVSAEGGPHRLGPGQVVFSSIASLEPGAEAVLRILAKAETEGNHIFRAEVHCKPLGIRLVSEETTHFYADGPTGAPARGYASGESSPTAAPHTADRRQPTVAPPQERYGPAPLQR